MEMLQRYCMTLDLLLNDTQKFSAYSIQKYLAGDVVKYHSYIQDLSWHEHASNLIRIDQ
jgi:hypothetical protein